MHFKLIFVITLWFSSQSLYLRFITSLHKAKKTKVHLTPPFFFLDKSNLLLIRSICAVAADDVYPGTKHNGASVCSLYLLENMESKINRSNIFLD